MAKLTVQVTRTHRVELEIHDGSLTPEELGSFSQGMFLVEGPQDLFKFAAAQATCHSTRATFFLEGVGPALMRTREVDAADERFPVLYRVVEEDVECEVVPC